MPEGALPSGTAKSTFFLSIALGAAAAWSATDSQTGDKSEEQKLERAMGIEPTS